ncbi:hypothetical protein EUBDOL_00433 [Amedibacillus dolichus DSM 3991]|uniref:Uncharacterized protein n=1 Tax=Amedibacillus dolichus DSM 3991 TaxID=428127 RepID=A8R8Z0_9FIRM|nr:hypothetical protein EUBDOL_00433 [Amedibacillus dolichus DSM 3991]
MYVKCLYVRIKMVCLRCLYDIVYGRNFIGEKKAEI